MAKELRIDIAHGEYITFIPTSEKASDDMKFTASPHGREVEKWYAATKRKEQSRDFRNVFFTAKAAKEALGQTDYWKVGKQLGAYQEANGLTITFGKGRNNSKQSVAQQSVNNTPVGKKVAENTSPVKEEVAKSPEEKVLKETEVIKFLHVLDKREDVVISDGDYKVSIPPYERKVCFLEDEQRGFTSFYHEMKVLAELQRLDLYHVVKDAVVSPEEEKEINLRIEQRMVALTGLARRDYEAQKQYELNEAFNEAIRHNDLEKMKKLFAAGAEMADHENDFGYRNYNSPLYLAYNDNEVGIDQEVVNFLVEHGATIEYTLSCDGEPVECSFLYDSIKDANVKAVRVFLNAGADPNWSGEDYKGRKMSIDEALTCLESKNSSVAKVIKDMIIEARNEKGSHEATNTDTVSSIHETKEEKNLGTPLPIISDENGMVHLAPRDNLRQSAVFPLTLFSDDGASILIQAAIVSDKINLLPNKKVSQEDLAYVKNDSVFLIPYSKAKEVVSEMEKHGQTQQVKTADMRINLFKNMGEKSPIEKAYNNGSLSQFVKSDKGLDK